MSDALRFLHPYRRAFALGLGLNVLARACDLLPLALAGKVIDAAVHGVTSPHTYLLFGLAVLASFVFLAIFQSGSDYVLSAMAQRTRHDIRLALYSRLQTLDPAYFEDRQTGDIMSVVVGDVDTLESFLTDATTSIIRVVVTFLGIYGYLFFLEWRLALLLFFPLPLAVFAIRRFVTRVQPRYRAARKAVGAIASLLENNIAGMGVIQAYTAEARLLAAVGERSAACSRRGRGRRGRTRPVFAGHVRRGRVVFCRGLCRRRLAGCGRDRADGWRLHHVHAFCRAPCAAAFCLRDADQPDPTGRSCGRPHCRTAGDPAAHCGPPGRPAPVQAAQGDRFFATSALPIPGASRCCTA